MDVSTTEAQVSACQDFLDTIYRAALIEAKQAGRLSIAIDFHTLPDLDFAEGVLDNPREGLQMLELALARLDLDLPEGFHIRLANIPQSCHVPLHAVRIEHTDRLIAVEGIIRNKSPVSGEVTMMRFECPMCATPAIILQEGQRILQQPTRCSSVTCAYRGKFTFVRDERTNAFSMALEEPTDRLDAVNQPAKLRVLCRGELATADAARLCYQGLRVEVTGIVKALPIFAGKDRTPRLEWYLDAHHIRALDDTHSALTWTADDVAAFTAFAQHPTWLKELRNAIFYDVRGYDEECEAIILQLFGCVGRQRTSKNVRGTLHILVVGDPGTCKSTLLSIAQKFAPKAMFVSASGISAAGIEGGVVKDELLGGWSLEAGALALCNNGIIMLDELDKTTDETRGHLHTAMEQEQVIISKIVKGTFMTRTSILAACNPKGGGFSSYDRLFPQIDLTPTLINRFDLVYPILGSSISGEDDEAIALKMGSHRYEGEGHTTPLTADWTKKYIAYAKKTILPTMEAPQRQRIAAMYRKLRESVQAEVGKAFMPITPRNGEAMYRLAEAVARSRLHAVVTDDDVDLAIAKVVYSTTRLGVDPNSGTVVEVLVPGPGGTFKPLLAKDLHARLCSVIRDRGREGIPHLELMSILETSKFTDENKIDEMLERMKKEGELYENPRGTYRWC